jgi:hypothetical protein
MALERWNERREQCLKSFATDSIGGLPQNDQGRAKGFIVNPQPLAPNDVRTVLGAPV